MAESTDQRIQKILRNKAKEKEADDLEKKLAKERSDERQATADRVRLSPLKISQPKLPV